MKNYFSTNIKFIREQKGLSQNKLGELLNVNQTTIARWEEENRIPTIDKAIDIALILNIPLNELVGKDLRLKNDETDKKELTPDEEMKLLKNTLKKKGLLDENEELSEENFNKLIEFAKVNKQFFMKDK